MNSVIKTRIVLLLAAVSIAGCAGSPIPEDDPYNQADTQRSRAEQAQDELEYETDRNK